MARNFRGRMRTASPLDPPRVGRYRARAQTNVECCERCGRAGRLDVHHKDGDPTNNAPENLEVLCRGCHLKHHRSRTCSVPNCKARHKGHGYCDKHYQRWVKWGTPFGFKRNQHTPFKEDEG